MGSITSAARLPSVQGLLSLDKRCRPMSRCLQGSSVAATPSDYMYWLDLSYRSPVFCLSFPDFPIFSREVLTSRMTGLP